jgi:hypothetical protein
MGLIEFGELRIEHSYIFIFFLVYLIFNLFKVSDFSNDPFISCFTYFLGELCCGIFIPITKYLNKSDITHLKNISIKENEENNDNSYQKNKKYTTFIYNEEEFKEINPDFNIIIIILISFIDFLCNFILFFSDNFIIALNKELDFFIILIILFLSSFILDMKIYNHHKLIIILITILGLLINYIQSLNEGKQKIGINNFISSFQKIMSNFLSIFILVISKFLMDKNYCSPFKILFFSGIFGIIYILFFSLFYHSITDDNNRNFYESLLENVIFKNFVSFLFSILNNFIYSLFSYLLIKHLYPTNLILALFSTKPILKIINYFIYSNSKLTFYEIILYILYIIFIFCCLIFNEFIILNFWGLNEFTKIGICNRGEKETHDMIIDNEEISEN